MFLDLYKNTIIVTLIYNCWKWIWFDTYHFAKSFVLITILWITTSPSSLPPPPAHHPPPRPSSPPPAHHPCKQAALMRPSMPCSPQKGQEIVNLFCHASYQIEINPFFIILYLLNFLSNLINFSHTIVFTKYDCEV